MHICWCESLHDELLFAQGGTVLAFNVRERLTGLDCCILGTDTHILGTGTHCLGSGPQDRSEGPSELACTKVLIVVRHRRLVHEEEDAVDGDA